MTTTDTPLPEHRDGEVDLEELEGVLAGMSPTPWRVPSRLRNEVYDTDDIIVAVFPEREADAAGIVALRNSAPSLLARVRAAEGRVRELEGALRKLEAIQDRWATPGYASGRCRTPDDARRECGKELSDAVDEATKLLRASLSPQPVEVGK